ncbi:MAG: hypothetical protein J0H64_08465, partial [Actinobacteria bacterium]|nr:hypothetical protein [Actinomycetota bacterium]
EASGGSGETARPAAVSAESGPIAGPNTATPSTGRVPGVPHNLGAGRTDPARSTVPAQAPTSTAAQAPAAQQPSTDPAAQQTPPAQPQLHYRDDSQSATPNPRRGDRVVTIVLLVIGAFGALYFAASMQQLPASLEMMASALHVSGFTVPASVSTLGTTGALLVLALYALNLILSIHRMRQDKLSFWVPLVAGVIAVILVFAFSAFVVAQTPELLKALSDPGAMQNLLDYLGSAGTTP